MSILCVRLSASNFSFSFDNTKSTEFYLEKYLLNFSKESIQKIMLTFLRTEFFSQFDRTGNKLIHHNNYLLHSIAGGKIFSVPPMKQPFCPTIFTIEDARLILSFTYTCKKKFGTNTLKLTDLFELLIILHEKIESEYKIDTTNEITTMKGVISSSLKSFGTIENSKFNIPEFNKNIKLLKEILNQPEGKECNQLFAQEYGFDIKFYIGIAYTIFSVLYFDSSSIFNIDKFFSIITINSPEQKIKQSFEKFINSLINNNVEEFSNELYDTSYLWFHNFEKLDDNSLLIKDLGIYTSYFINNLFITFESPFLNSDEKKKNNTNLNLRSNVLGTAFEHQVKNELIKISGINFLQNIYTGKYENDEISDLVFNIGDTLFLGECKAGFLSVRETITQSGDKILEKILKKFGGKFESEDSYKKLKKEERKGILQIIHNYSIINSEFENSFKNIQHNDQKIFQKIKNVYGIVFVQENHLSVFALNRLLYLYNNEYVELFKNTNFHPPIFINIIDIYKIINSGKNSGNQINFKDAIVSYIENLKNGYVDSFNSFLINAYNYPQEADDKEHKKIVKELLNEVYSGSGLPMPNIII